VWVAAALACLLGACGVPPPAAERACADIDQDLLPLLDARGSDVVGARGMGATWTAARAWVEHQLVTHDEWVALGSCSLRNGRLEVASRAFAVANRRVRHSVDAAVGLGHVALRSGRPAEAVQQFCQALERAPRSDDAREGLHLALERLPVGDPAAATARDLLEERVSGEFHDDQDRLLLAMAARRNGGSGELRRRAGPVEGDYSYEARVGKDYLEVRNAEGAWHDVFVKGINIGPALPGRFASEAPEDEATWSAWLGNIADLGANAVRVYTLQPPAFYRALARHNAGPEAARLWLLQGVWADLPPEDDFDEPGYVAAFQAEIARVIDAVHGNLILDPERGHARGVYDADVSRQTLAWIVGREWEPFAVAAYLSRRPERCSHDGRYVRVGDGNAMECWIARTLDYAAGYEAEHHRHGRPLTFANWPTLDPLHHPTEATRDEEDRLRSALAGVPAPERSVPAWDDDAVTVDASVMSRGSEDTPGVFASYHIYPNFPYFMNLEPAYAAVEDDEGPLRYAGYLRELKAHHGEQPVLVAEFGMSTSRGIAHVQPEGLHHGGHDESEAMHQSARLLRAIHAGHMAGGVAFEFMDEWFKGTWSTSPFEVPDEHRPRWFNAESPEQSYGIFANRPAAPVRPDGDASDWSDRPYLAESRDARSGWAGLKGLKATYDAGWVYVLLETAGSGEPDWSSTTITLGLDTYDSRRGERVLPPPANCETPTGVEFAVTLGGPDHSELLVTPTYLQRHPAESAGSAILYSPVSPTGGYSSPALETNRERYTRDRQRIAPVRVAPGRLRFGSLDPGSQRFDTRSDVATGAHGVIEIRLPWALLNFADPSSRRVLHSEAPADVPGTLETDEIRLYACATSDDADDLQQLPPAVLQLRGWIVPDYVFEAKHGVDQLREAFVGIPAAPSAPPGGSPP